MSPSTTPTPNQQAQAPAPPAATVGASGSSATELAVQFLKQIPPPVLEPITVWRPTKRWTPFRTNTFSGGSAVECAKTNALGLAKPIQTWNEWLAWRLSVLMGVKVPEVRFGSINGSSRLQAISILFGRRVMDLDYARTMLGNDFDTEPVIQKALAAASGLLPFYAWIGLQDVKDEHLLLNEDTGEIAGIDHGFSFRWATPDDPIVEPFAPPALCRLPDRAVVERTLARIEAVQATHLEDVLLLVPDGILTIDNRMRVSGGLVSRRDRIRAMMIQKGWLP